MSTLNEIQKQCTEAVGGIDKKYNIERDLQLAFTQLMEEVGELAKEINRPRLRSQEIDRENLNGEFGDVVMQLFMLASLLEIDIEEAVLAKIKVVKERHGL